MKNHDTVDFTCDFNTAEKFYNMVKKRFTFSKFVTCGKLTVQRSEINFITHEIIEDAK